VIEYKNMRADLTRVVREKKITKTKKLSTWLVPVNLRLMCFMMIIF
jgi:hypothetical protein